MYTCKKCSYLIVVIKFCLFCNVQSYPNRCPVAKEWELLSSLCSTKSLFHCLFHEHHGKYATECRSWDWVQPGHYPILRGSFIDYAKCSSKSYQPVAFKSHNSHQCLFIKSMCSEEGQMESLQPVSTKTDRSCICDQSKGFDNVIKMKNELGCISSLEDCTCYIKNYRPEYQLKSRYNLENMFTNLDDENFTHNNSFVKTNSTRVKYFGQNTKVIQIKGNRQHVLMGSISMVLLFIIIFLVLLFRFQIIEDPNITGTVIKVDDLQTSKPSIALDCKDNDLGKSIIPKASENTKSIKISAMTIPREEKENVHKKTDATKRSAVLPRQTTKDTKKAMPTTEVKRNVERDKTIVSQANKKGHSMQSDSTNVNDKFNKRHSAVIGREKKTQNDKPQETKLRRPLSYNEKPSQRQLTVSKGTGKPVDIKRIDSRGKEHPPKQPWR